MGEHYCKLCFDNGTLAGCPNCGSYSNQSRVSAAPDPVNQPQHYQLFPGVEAIEIIAASLTAEEFRGYALGNALKYRLRAGAKDDLAQDIAKATKYVELFERYKKCCRKV